MAAVAMYAAALIANVGDAIITCSDKRSRVSTTPRPLLDGLHSRAKSNSSFMIRRFRLYQVSRNLGLIPIPFPRIGITVETYWYRGLCSKPKLHKFQIYLITNHYQHQNSLLGLRWCYLSTFLHLIRLRIKQFLYCNNPYLRRWISWNSQQNLINFLPNLA